MFHVKHPAALGAVAAHQEEVRAGSSSRFALRTLRPAPSSPAPARDPRTQRASAQYAPIHLRKHSLASFRVARLEPISRTPLQLFRLRGAVQGRKRRSRGYKDVHQTTSKCLLGAFGGFLNLPRSRKRCREARFFYSSCTSGRLAEGPLPSEYASHETPRRRCRRHAA